MSKVKYVEKDQVWMEAATIYWFNIDGVLWGVHESEGLVSYLDYQGYPVDQKEIPILERLLIVTDEMRMEK